MPSTPNSKGFQRGQYSNFKIIGRNRNNRRFNEIDDGIPDDGPIISERLLQDSRSCHGILNADQDDEMKVTGYRRSSVRTAFCWICIILTCGLLRLFMHWRRHWLLLATHSPCPLDIAEKVFVRENYQGKHTLYYVKDVITLNVDTVKKMSSSEKSEWKNYFPFDESIDDKQFHLSIHFSSGNFKNMDSVRLFRCKQLRYIWDIQTQSFQKLKGLDVNIPSNYLHQRKGLSHIEQLSRRLVYGLNEITIPVRGVFTLLFLEVLNPFYVFQIFSVCLWISYSYYYYAVVIVLMSAFGITMSIIQTKKNQDALRNTVQNSDCALVVYDNGQVERVETQYLVPGDIVEIPSSGCTMQCDAVLLSGNCILDESMLTGESVPVTKTPLPLKRDLIFDAKEHSRHTLFSGTKIIQTRYIGSEKVLAVVINTGNITAKGGLIRSILYPPPVDYKFEQDSYKFITLLGLIAGVGFVYTLVTKISRAVSAGKIAIESLDLITIAVPPALPAAMTVGRFNAQKRLENKNIYCISPRSINVSGSIDCVCFDKTGTLTEDGLDMWGVVPKSTTNQFQIPLKHIDRLPLDHFLFGMVTCHSITIMNNELKGDPLDLKMFESTGWILEEANVADDNKYDLLFPTIVRQPKNDKLQSANPTPKSSDEDLFGSNDIGIVREFSFTSSLQRMSVITRRLSDNHFNVYCKGSPEMIQTLCKPESIPDNYLNQLDIYAQQGYRIIAVAYKPLDKKITYARVQRIGRDKVECDLEFQGFVILENRLKPDTTDVIHSLNSANIRTVMVTGDNMLTALSVAKDCGIIAKKQSVITVNTRQHPTIPGKYEIYYNLTGANIPTSASILTNQHNNQHQQNTIQITPNGNGDVCSLITNSNSVVSLSTIDTWTHHDVELGIATSEQNGTAAYDSSLTNRKQHKTGTATATATSTTNNNDYRFAMVGKTWSIIKDYFPELLPKFVTRGTIFARMSPDQKQSLILELQSLGYYVAMCGDGANDCGALKAAHTGISLSEAESSVASPFTSKNPTIACVPNVIREGRAALVTSFGIFKYMAAYSLVQFISVLILYNIDSNLTDIQFLYIDLGLISVFAFFFGKIGAYNGPLVKQAPLSSLISLSPIMSLILHLIVATTFQIIGWYHVRSQEWFIPFNFTDTDDDSDLGCYENYTIFILSCFQYIILAFVFSKGKPYRKSIISNKFFLITLIINTIIVIYLAINPAKSIETGFGLIMPPDYNFRIYLIIYGIINFLISLFIEAIIIEYLLFKKLRYRWHNINKSRRKYLLIEKQLNDNYKWPPLSYYSSDINSLNNDYDKSSPVSYAEISAEHGIDIRVPETNSVLNNFFDTKLNCDDDDDNDDNNVVKTIYSNDNINSESDYDDDDEDEYHEYNCKNMKILSNTEPVKTYLNNINNINNNNNNNNNMKNNGFEMMLNPINLTSNDVEKNCHNNSYKNLTINNHHIETTSIGSSSGIAQSVIGNNIQQQQQQQQQQNNEHLKEQQQQHHHHHHHEQQQSQQQQQQHQPQRKEIVKQFSSVDELKIGLQINNEKPS